MKKLSSVLFAALTALLLSVSVFAADEIEIPLDAEHVGMVTYVLEEVSADRLYFFDGGISADGVTMFSLYLPEPVPLGETVVIHIKGTCHDDFRMWLLAKEESADRGMQATFSNQWAASENAVLPPVTFNRYIEFTAEDYDEQGGTAADRVAIKAQDWQSTLDNFNLSYLGVIYGSLDEVNAEADAEAEAILESIQDDIDAVNKALKSAKSAGSNTDTIYVALADARVSAERIAAVADTCDYEQVRAASKDAASAVKDIESLLKRAKKQKKDEEDMAASAMENERSRMKSTAIAVIVIAILIVLAVLAVSTVTIIRANSKKQ